MKQENYTYMKTENKDPSPNDPLRAHKKVITCMIIIKPEDLMQESAYQQKNNV